MNLRVSVVIPCRNEERYIGDCVRSILSNGYEPNLLEILVVDGESTDRTRSVVAEISRDHPQVRLIPNPRRLTPFALNVGIAHATGEYVLIASAHCSLDKGYIRTLVNRIESLACAIAVGGVMRAEANIRTATSMAIKTALSSRFGVGNAHFRLGVSEVRKVDTVPFGLYRTAQLREVGGYDERLIRNHDIELSKRLLQRGGFIYLIPEATCVYYARERYWPLARNSFGNGKWNVLTVLFTRNHRSISVRHMVPLLFVLSLVGPCILAVWFPPMMWLFVASLTAYIAGVSTVITNTKREGTTSGHLLWAFIVLHISYGFGSLAGFLSAFRRLKQLKRTSSE